MRALEGPGLSLLCLVLALPALLPVPAVRGVAETPTYPWRDAETGERLVRLLQALRVARMPGLERSVRERFLPVH
uniref:Decoy receptor 3 variant 1 n=1 Tax=Homo sapiens TaxID=9606 RepID=Q6EMV4_HUMAN|nr:decoy receptor 3 variant 1 [Homo sapiens]